MVLIKIIYILPKGMISLTMLNYTGSLPNINTTSLIDVSAYTNIHLMAFYNCDSDHVLNWASVQPSGGLVNYDFTEVLNVSAGDTLSKVVPVRAKYLSVTYYPSVLPATLRCTHYGS